MRERDVDFLVLEEFSVSQEFREWFSSRVFGKAVYKSKVGVWHSARDNQYGESDLTFLFKDIDGGQTAILIENKIDAPPQPLQGQRYQLRGAQGVERGDWSRFKTCAMAPSKYLGSAKHTEIYDVEISYEEIQAYFQSRSGRDERFAYKAQIMFEAIEQNRRGYQAKVHEGLSQFVLDYFKLVSSTPAYQELGMEDAKARPARNTWIYYQPDSWPKDIRMIHQMTAGFVKVMFFGKTKWVEEIKTKYESLLPNEATIAQTGKSVFIAIQVPQLDPRDTTFNSQRAEVKQALDVIHELESIVRVNGWI